MPLPPRPPEEVPPFQVQVVNDYAKKIVRTTITLSDDALRFAVIKAMREGPHDVCDAQLDGRGVRIEQLADFTYQAVATFTEPL